MPSRTGVNCKGVMGAGIAKVFAERYPAMKKAYVKMCEHRSLLPGDCQAWHEPDFSIYNLATQYRRVPMRRAPLGGVVGVQNVGQR